MRMRLSSPLVSGEGLPNLAVPVLDLNDAEVIADVVLARAELYVPSRS
jgi:hypothetical protein